MHCPTQRWDLTLVPLLLGWLSLRVPQGESKVGTAMPWTHGPEHNVDGASSQPLSLDRWSTDDTKATRYTSCSKELTYGSLHMLCTHAGSVDLLIDVYQSAGERDAKALSLLVLRNLCFYAPSKSLLASSGTK